MKTKLVLSVIAAATWMGCGGNDGPSDSTKLSEVTAAEAKDLCLELAADFPEKTVDCGMGLTVTVGLTTAECADKGTAPASCTATVGDARDCTETLYNNSQSLCSDGALPASCTRLMACN